MPATVREMLPLFIDPAWQPGPCPDLTAEPFADVDAPWRESIRDRKVDWVRTAGLGRKDVNVDVEISFPGTMLDGSVHGMPYQVLGRDRQSQKFVEAGLPPRYVRTEKFWLFFTRDVFEPITVTLDVPPVIRRESDPGGGSDNHAYFLDLDRQTLTELFQVNHQLGAAPWEGWTVGYGNLGASAVARWDMTRPFYAPGQPAGVVAGGFPQMPHVIRYDELKAGRVRHASFLVLANYAPEFVGYARHTDGSFTGHPVRAGDRLRPTRELLERYPVGTPDRTIVEGWAEHGVTLGDRSSHSGSATDRSAKIPLAQDDRIQRLPWHPGGLSAHPSKRKQPVRLSDFELVQT